MLETVAETPPPVNVALRPDKAAIAKFTSAMFAVIIASPFKTDGCTSPVGGIIIATVKSTALAIVKPTINHKSGVLSFVLFVAILL